MSEPSEARTPQLPACWLDAIGDEFDQAYMNQLRAFLQEERQQHKVFPRGQDMFKAFWLTPFKDVRVVILGQDPYHGQGQAHGLCFSVNQGVRPPPSLQNVFRELSQDLGVPHPSHGELVHWAKQGVLLLNTVLSVRAHQANSHRGQGWERLTDRVICELNRRHEGLVFVLWGSAAGRKAAMVDGRRHYILRAPHPSPLSAHRGFFGCGHFSKINKYLSGRDSPPMDWSLPEY